MKLFTHKAELFIDKIKHVRNERKIKDLKEKLGKNKGYYEKNYYIDENFRKI